MAHFPLDTSHILTLSENMVAGFKDNHTVYPSPPISSADLEDLRDAAVTAYEAQVAAPRPQPKPPRSKNRQLWPPWSTG